MLLRFYTILFIICFYSIIGKSQSYKTDPIKIDSSLFSSEKKIITNIQIVGNKKTKQHIILRELVFANGDTIITTDFLQQLEQSQKNLLNTTLFNFVQIDWAALDSSRVFVVIQLTERWYLFPLPIFEIDDNNFNTWWKDKDFSRINYGGQLIQENFRGRKEKLNIVAKYGFTERYRIKHQIPYLNKAQTIGMAYSFSYNRLDEVAIGTINNKRITYKSDNNDALQNLAFGLGFSFRKKIFASHSVGFSYDNTSIESKLLSFQPNYLPNRKTRTEFLSIFYRFVFDNRDSKNYPLNGSFFSGQISKQGFNLFANAVDQTKISASVKKFIPIVNRLYLASSLGVTSILRKNDAYITQAGLGYSSYGLRGYEFYVIDGQQVGLSKTQLRYQLVKPKSAKVGFLPIPQLSKFHYALYLGAFTDFAYVQDDVGFVRNDLANEIQFGTGLGLDFVTFYDIVIRAEYSFNKFGESGFFFHFVAPI